jgi:hypothetical protein
MIFARLTVLHLLAQGSSAPQTAATATPTPCSLATRAELEQIVKHPLRDGRQDGARCVYEPGGDPPLRVTIEVHWKDGQSRFDAVRAAAEKPEQTESRNSATVRVTRSRGLRGLGDEAFFNAAGVRPLLCVREGDRAIIVETSRGTQDQLASIARLALGRLR